MKIQLKRSNVLQSGAAKEPTASQLAYGELAVNYSSSDPAIFLKDSNNNIIRISGVGNIADDGITNVPAGTTPPTNPAPEAGNLWYNSDEGRLYIYYVDTNTSQWVDASPDSWDPTVMPVTTNPAAQSGTLDDRYVMENGDTMTGALLLDNAASSSAPDLSFDGDADTGIYSPGANQVAVATGGTGRLFIDSSGDVGIGTTSPATALHVSGSGTQRIRITGTGEANAILTLDAPSSYINYIEYGASASTPLAFYDLAASTERMRIDSSGNLGIGTSSPNIALDVHGINNTTFINFKANLFLTGTDTYNSGNSGSGILFSGKYNSADTATTFAGISGIKENTTDANTQGALLFGTRDSAGSTAIERMRIDSSGLVGIGSNSPSSYNLSANQLVVSNTASACGVTVVSSTGSTGNIFFADGTSGTSVAEGYLQYNHAGNDLKLGTSNTERMCIDSSGNVGIGTSSPQTYGNPTYNTLDVVGTNGGVIQSTSSNSAVKTYFYSDSSNSTGRIGTVTNHPFLFVTNSTERMRITTEGEVGIGGITPDTGRILHLKHPTASTTLQLELAQSLTTGYNTIQFENDDNKNAYVWQNASSGPAIYGGSNALNVANYYGPIVFASHTLGLYGEKMRVLPTGGLTFNGDTAQANALNDYEEGSWSPTVVGNTTSGTVAYSTRVGVYTKIGNIVSIQFYVVYTGGTGAGSLEITSLPYLPSGGFHYSGVSIGYFSSVSVGTNYVATSFIGNGVNTLHFYRYPVGGGSASPLPYDPAANILASAVYKVA